MALTVSDIQQRARERYNAEDDLFFSDQMLRALIFSAQEELAKEGWVIENTFQTDSVADQRGYAYPDNTLGIKEVRYDFDKLYKRPLRSDPKTSTSDPTGTPRGYAVWDNTIILYPTPDTSSDTIQIRTYSYPQDITTNNSALEVPQEYRDDLIDYCIAHMALKDQNTPLYNVYIDQWRLTVQKAKEQRRKRLRSDRPSRVKDDYFGSDLPVTVDEVFFYGFTF